MDWIKKIFEQYEQNIFAVDDECAEYTYGDIFMYAQRLLGLLNKEGATAVYTGNSIVFYCAVMAGLFLEQPVYVFHRNFPESLVERNLKELHICNVITDELSENLVRQYPANWLEVKNLKSIRRIRNLHWIDSTATDELEKKNLIYIATSGTTGASKWVCHHIRSILGNMKSMAKRLGITSKDRIHSILPLFTANGLTITFFLPFVAGASVYLDGIFDPFTIKDYFKNGRKNGVTVLSLIPAVISVLNQITSEDTKQKNQISSFRFAICGTAPLHTEDKKRFEHLTGILVYVNYGLTETLFVSTQCQGFAKDRSSGILLEGVSVLQDKKGRIKVGGSYLMMGEPDKKKIGSWDTGDLGFVLDHELYITGRDKDRIIINGYNVNPNAVEQWMCSKVYVSEACCFGIEKNEKEVLYCALIPAYGFSAEDVRKLVYQDMKEELEAYMHPKILTVSDIPRNIQGKPLKRELINSILIRSEI